MASLGRPRVGISACLLGEKVRYDGRDKAAPWLLGPFARRVTWVAVCPEVELGLGVPREPIRLVGRAGAPRLVVVGGKRDLTEAMARFASQRLKELAKLGLDGWITKAGSPSCGLRRVPIHSTRGRPASRAGVGLFVGALRRRFPGLPIEEEGRLEDPKALARFLARVRAHQAARRGGGRPRGGAGRIGRR